MDILKMLSRAQLALPLFAVAALLGVSACDTKDKTSTSASTAIDPNASVQTGTATTGDDAMNGAAGMHDDMAQGGRDGGRRMERDDRMRGGPPAAAGPPAGVGPQPAPGAPAAMPPADPAAMPMNDHM